MKYIPEVIRRKETNWGYEKEVRLFGVLDKKADDGSYYINIPCSSVKKVYLGLRSNSTTELIASCLKKRTEYNHLKIYKMHKDPSSYKLISNEI